MKEPKHKYLTPDELAHFETLSVEQIKGHIANTVEEMIENDKNEKEDNHVKECKEALKAARELYVETRGSCKETLAVLSKLLADKGQ